MSVSRETRLDLYRQLLLKWGSAINLSSDTVSTSDGFDHQVADSLLLVPHLPPDTTSITDLGSGQGFPAIPLGVETSAFITMIEADRRKAAFLTTVLAVLQLPGTVISARIENCRQLKASCITAKALAPIDRLVAYARPLLSPGGCCLFLKGPNHAIELANAKRSASFTAEVFATPAKLTFIVKLTNLT